MNPISIRLLSQQLCAPQFSKPEDVVRHFGAMQGQEYRLMRWAVAMRTKKPSAKAFQKAYDSGKIIRLHLLRGTWQLVAAEDYHWMLDLFADKARRVIQGWMSANNISIPDDEYAQIRAILLQCASEKGSATKEDFVNTLAEHHIVMDDHRLSYHIRMAELAGVLCSGDLHPAKMTYALAETKVPQTEPIESDEALIRLARKYFQSHSPATLEDFVWWSGLGFIDCRKAIALLGTEILSDKWKKNKFYLHFSARTRGFRKGDVLLLPPYDEYLIGYKSRDIALDETLRHKAHNNMGTFFPVIAHDGIISGNWKPFEKRLMVELFDGSDITPEIEAEWTKYQQYRNR